MTPTVDERLASVIRALGEVILPHLPENASLAQEQVQLAIGHLQILQAQFDQIPAFEADELEDYRQLAMALLDGVTGGEASEGARPAIYSALENGDDLDVRDQRLAINEAVEKFINATSSDGDEGAQNKMTTLILEHEKRRTKKDREWFAPFGFDTL